MPLTPAMRVVRAIQLQGALADAQRAAEGGKPHIPALPSGMKWLVSPREALDAKAGHPHGASRPMEIAFARWLYWRILLLWRRPTRESAVRMAHRLRGATLWRLAVKCHQEGKLLPLKAGVNPSSVPAWAVSGQRNTLPEAVRAGDMDPWDYWDTFGDGDQYVDLIDGSQIMSPDDYADAGGVLTFEDILGSLHDFGYTDLDIAQLLDAAWNGQASLWAGQNVYSDAGIMTGFGINDPNFYLYLRNQAGYLISGIDATTRSNIASALWGLLGGPDYFSDGLPVDRVGKALATWFGSELGPSADYRAYMIAVTETARAESYGTFVALWSTGARQKIWIANAGACIYCVENVEAGAILLTQAFPTGHQAPPAHVLCRCAISAALVDSFVPDDWVSRNPDALDPLLFNWSGAVWPNIDLSDVELPGIDESDFERAARARRPERPHGVREVYAQSVRLADAVETLTRQWLRDAHVRMPATEADIRTLAKRLRDPDEVPDAREADEQYLHRLRGAIGDVLRAGALHNNG